MCHSPLRRECPPFSPLCLSPTSWARENFKNHLRLPPAARQRKNKGKARRQVEETPAAAESRLPDASRLAAFLQVLTNFRDDSLGRFLCRWLGGNKSNPSAAPAASAVCVRLVRSLRSRLRSGNCSLFSRRDYKSARERLQGGRQLQVCCFFFNFFFFLQL